jgi:NADH dehydrogenase
MENRASLLIKWLWSIGVGKRASLLITGRPNQHLNVEVGLDALPSTDPPDALGPENI